MRALPSFSITASLAVATLAIGTLVGALVSRQVMMSARSPGGPGAEGAAFALSLGAVALLVAALDPTKRGGAAAAFATVAWVPFLVHGAWTRLHDVIGLGFAYQGLNVEGLLLTLLVLPLAPLGAALLVRVRRVAIGATAAAGLLCLLGVVRFKPDPFAFVSAAKPVATLDVGAPVAFPGGVLTERRTGTTSYPADEMNPAGTVPECTFFVASRRVDAWFSGCAKYEVLHDEATDLVLVGSADELHQYGRPGLVLRWSTGERVTPRWVDLHDSLAPPAVWLVSSGGGAVLALAALLLAAVLRRRAAAHPRDPVPAPHEGRVASLQTFAVSCVVLTSAELAVAALERLVF